MSKYTELFQIKLFNTKLGTEFPLPSQATVGSAGTDLRVMDEVIIPAGEHRLVGAGFGVYIQDPNFAGMILPRSSAGIKKGLRLRNTVGLIDSDYQGELLMCLENTSQEDVVLEAGERVAQLVIIPIVGAAFTVVEEFEASERGDGGIGSTGTQ